MDSNIKSLNQSLYEVDSYKKIRDIMLKEHILSYDSANKSYDFPINYEKNFWKIMNIVRETEEQLGHWKEI